MEISGKPPVFRMKLSRHVVRRIVFGYALLTPAFVLTSAFFAWPLLRGILASLYRGAGTQTEWVGLKNYWLTLTDARFWNSLRVSVVFTLLFILLSVGTALILATMLVKKPRGYVVYLSALFVPYISTPVIGALIWSNMLSAPFGMLNSLLTHIGYQAVPWLKTPMLALLSITLVQVWYTLGYNTILFMAGLQAIPVVYMEAAELDGCSFRQKLWHIYMPLLIPTIVFVLTVSILYGFINSYVLATMITGGGPMEATNVMMNYVFEIAFDRFELGRANAVTMLIFLLFVVLSVLQVNFQRKKFAGLH